jgi:hypothetical protein
MDQPHAATAMIDDSPATGAFLSVRSCPEAGASAVYWDDSSLECALARDIIVGSGGVPTESGGFALVARYDSVQSAAMAARRVQWSVQGFADGSQPHTLSIRVLAGDDMAREDHDAQLLEQAPGGRIVVGEAAARALEEIPAFVVKPAEENPAVRELAWRADESQTTRAADEEAVARFIEQSGHAVYPAGEAEAGSQPAMDTTSWAEAEPERKSRTMLWVGLAAGVVIAASAAFFILRPKPEEKKVAIVETPVTSSVSQTPSSTTPTSGTPAGTTSPAATNPAVEKAGAPLTKAQKRELERQQKAQQAGSTKVAKDNTVQSEPQAPAQEPKHQEPAKVGGNCQYSADQIPGLIQQAEISRGRRQYSVAKRKLQAALACEPGNSKAREALDLVRQAEAAEGGSEPQ